MMFGDCMTMKYDLQRPREPSAPHDVVIAKRDYRLAGVTMIGLHPSGLVCACLIDDWKRRYGIETVRLLVRLTLNAVGRTDSPHAAINGEQN